MQCVAAKSQIAVIFCSNLYEKFYEKIQQMITLHIAGKSVYFELDAPLLKKITTYLSCLHLYLYKSYRIKYNF